MGKIVKPAYRIEGMELLTCEDGSLIRNKILFAWHARTQNGRRGDGKPTASNLAAWRKAYIGSFAPGKPNGHLGPIAPNVGTLRIIDQRNGDVVAEYVPPTFEVLP